jgi:tRNA threonylcarbamoyl adenosine modification protein YeaZ
MSDPRTLVAFDTSGSVGSVAVGRGGEVLARGWLVERREHGARLIPEIAATLVRAGVGREELDGVLVGRGPGSFTGVRIAAATAKGLAKALTIPLWHHSSLAAGAASAGAELPRSIQSDREPLEGDSGEGEAQFPWYVLFDARSDRLFTACYRVRSDRVDTVLEPKATTLGGTLGAPVPEGARFCGEGALRHASSITGAGYPVRPFPCGLPTAEGLLRVHWRSRLSGSETGNGWEPEYLRGSPHRLASSPEEPS